MRKQNSPHISDEQLSDLAFGDAAESETREHLAACAECAAQFGDLRRLVSALSEPLLENAPQYAVANAFRAFDDYLAARQNAAPVQKPSLKTRLLAILQTDDAAASRPAFGVRSNQPSAARQIFFAAGEIEMEIRIAPAAGELRLSGQLFNYLDDGDASLELFDADGNSVARADLTARFEFSFPPVAAGIYTLRFSSATIEIEIPDLKAEF